MAVDLNVAGNCDLAGFNLVAIFEPLHPTGTATVYRIVDGVTTTVRGLTDLDVAVVGNSVAVVDTEAPLDTPITYQLIHRWGSGGSDWASAVTDEVTLDCPGVGDFVLRNLFYMENFLMLDVCVGTLPDGEIVIGSNEFKVLGRRDPVIIVDTLESEKGELIFLADNQPDVDQLRFMLSTGDPLLLQAKDAYDVGDNGVLYFMPKRVRPVRLNPDGRSPLRRFEVDYTRISPPPNAIVFTVPGRTYEYVDDTYATYSDVLAGVNDYYELLYGESMSGGTGSTPGGGGILDGGIVDGGTPSTVYSGEDLDGGGA